MPAGFPAMVQLTETIRHRKQQPSTASYTSTLLAGGTTAISAKINEEADELVAAAAQLNQAGGETAAEAREHLIHEAADLLYHTMVMLAFFDADLTDVDEELAARFGKSGLEEKAGRKNRE